MIRWVLDRLFRRDVFPVWVTERTFERWLLFKISDGRRVYLHHFFPQTDKWSHTHVRGLISFGIWGAYSEETWDKAGNSLGEKRWSAPWVRYFPHDFRHRFTVQHGESAWTLCVIDHDAQDWHFYTETGEAIPWHLRLLSDGHARGEDGEQRLDDL